MDVTIYPEPNPAISAALVSPATRAFVEERINTAQMLYQAQVAKRSGQLARSAHAHVQIGGANHDRWVGELVVGGGGVDYAAAHEFGRGSHPGSIHNFDGEDVTQGPAHDLNHVLQMLAAY